MNEVQIDGREWPADIFVDRWTTPDPAAVDVTVTQPLAPSLGLNTRTSKENAAAKQKQKLAKYALLIAATQLHFIPVPITAFGTLGPATQFIDDAADFYSAKCAVDRGLCRKPLVERETTQNKIRFGMLEMGSGFGTWIRNQFPGNESESTESESESELGIGIGKIADRLMIGDRCHF